MKFETLAIRMQLSRSEEREHSVPLYPTSSFIFDDAEHMRSAFAGEDDSNIYSRFANPNGREFELKMAALEGCEDAYATASGMAAIFASFMALLNSGDHIIASRSLFGASYGVLCQILPKYGIHTSFIDPESPETWHESLRPETKMMFLETPTNPGLIIVDLEKAGSFAKEHQLILNVDNCFATPYIQNPAKYGAHIVTHSATKFIDGQGRVVGGLVAGNHELIDTIRKFCRKTGPSISPFNAWILSKSLETLHVRLDRHCESAYKLASQLQDHPDIERVCYPFLPSHPQHEIAKRQMKLGGGIVTFVVKGGMERGQKFLDQLQLLSLTANLGDSRTIATHPPTSTHSKLSEEERRIAGIDPGLIRISVGLEHFDDILHDIDQALVSTTEKGKIIA